MSDITMAGGLLDDIAAPRGARESYKAVLHRVTRAVNAVGAKLNIIEAPIPSNRLDDIWRREARFVRAYEMRALEAAREAKLLGEARDVRNSVLARIEALEARLAAGDQDFHRDQIAALRGSILGAPATGSVGAGRRDSALD
ncbi:hypothetical protein SAMN05519103_00325 [Rhizobiales bacterium GAS113]|nr:hypothetical protein SAMN05519103_00325 [Rhizobiales bacterium GAS113]